MSKILKALPLIVAVTAAATPASAGTLKTYAGPVTYKVTFPDIVVSSFNACASAATYKLVYTNTADGSVFKTKTGRVAAQRSFTDTLTGGLPANKTLLIRLEHTCEDGTNKPPLTQVSMGRETSIECVVMKFEPLP